MNICAWVNQYARMFLPYYNEDIIRTSDRTVGLKQFISPHPFLITIKKTFTPNTLPVILEIYKHKLVM